MQPTKLPDDLFADDDWQRADYPRRVALLVERYLRGEAQLTHTNEHLGRVLVEAGELRHELRGAREANAALVLEIEATYRLHQKN